MRPLLISRSLHSVVYWPRPTGSPKLPGSFFGSCGHTKISTAPLMSTKRMRPYVAGGVNTQAMPVGTSWNPGNLIAVCATAPTAAIIATRPCFNSAARRLLKPSLSPTFEKPNGSKYPRGGVAPSSFAGLKGGGGGGSSFLAAFSAPSAVLAAFPAPSAASAILRRLLAATTATAPPPAQTSVLACKALDEGRCADALRTAPELCQVGVPRRPRLLASGPCTKVVPYIAEPARVAAVAAAVHGPTREDPKAISESIVQGPPERTRVS